MRLIKSKTSLIPSTRFASYPCPAGVQRCLLFGALAIPFTATQLEFTTEFLSFVLFASQSQSLHQKDAVDKVRALQNQFEKDSRYMELVLYYRALCAIGYVVL